jgi:hypothetical protein
MSSIRPYLDHPSYRKLVNLGWPAVPLILEAYSSQTMDDHCWWNFLLQEITGIKRVDPLNASFSPDVEDDFWLRKWRRNRDP